MSYHQQELPYQQELPSTAQRTYFISYIPQKNPEHSPMRSLAELRDRLHLEIAAPLPKVLVVPSVIETFGGPPVQFYEDHLQGTAPTPTRYSAPQMACRWRFPQLVTDGWECSDTKISSALGKHVVLSASFWCAKVPMLFVSQPMFTSSSRPFEDKCLDQEIAWDFPAQYSGEMKIEEYINFWVYHRWVAFLGALRPSDLTREMLFVVMKALEQNLEEVRYLSGRGWGMSGANVGDWKELLDRLMRRVDIMASGVFSKQEVEVYTGEAASAG
ncbi:hypothetical protein N5P37_010860 [Trichoderma harzianum]|nr:hypothetical protein N5P37_010860 [Trichoderma harzianum]